MHNIYDFGAGTYADELIAQIKNNAPKEIETVKSLYEAFDSSKMLQGQKYYWNESDIMEREICLKRLLGRNGKIHYQS